MGAEVPPESAVSTRGAIRKNDFDFIVAGERLRVRSMPRIAAWLGQRT
jgi:hypothetical protein